MWWVKGGAEYGILWILFWCTMSLILQNFDHNILCRFCYGFKGSFHIKFSHFQYRGWHFIQFWEYLTLCNSNVMIMMAFNDLFHAKSRVFHFYMNSFGKIYFQNNKINDKHNWCWNILFYERNVYFQCLLLCSAS